MTSATRHSLQNAYTIPPTKQVPNWIPSPSLRPNPRFILLLALLNAVAIPLTECTSWNAASCLSNALNQVFLKLSAARWDTIRKKKFCNAATTKAYAPTPTKMSAMRRTGSMLKAALPRSENEFEKT